MPSVEGGEEPEPRNADHTLRLPLITVLFDTFFFWWVYRRQKTLGTAEWISIMSFTSVHLASLRHNTQPIPITNNPRLHTVLHFFHPRSLWIRHDLTSHGRCIP